MLNLNQLKGKTVEDLGASYLQKKGYRILERNFRSRFGEIDIIATHHHTLIFIEVKARDTDTFGKPYEAVTPRKIRSISQTGQYYKQLHPKTPESLQIDVLSLSTTPNGDIAIEHLENVTG